MSGLWLNIVSFINTYAAPVGMTNSGWKFSIMYLVVDALGVVVIYLTFVETKGRTLDEIDENFADPKPVKRSLKRRQVVIGKEE
jgi:hypothetical protein